MAVSAFAQDPPGPPPLAVRAPDAPPIELSLPPGTASVQIGALELGGLFQSATAPEVGGFGSTWQTSATAGFHAPGGFHVSASLVGRRGYDAPLFMAVAPGSDAMRASLAVPLVTTARVPVVWDTRLRVERRVRTGRRLHIDAVAEAFNLLNPNPAAVSGTLTSRTFRIGLVLGF